MLDTVHGGRRVSRRAFVGGAAVAASAVTLPGALPTLLAAGSPPAVGSGSAAAFPRSGSARAPVVGFHMDRPFLDPTGRAEPYCPPAGTRSGEALAQLSEREFLSRHPYG